jgi:hypothetical protein
MLSSGVSGTSFMRRLIGITGGGTVSLAVDRAEGSLLIRRIAIALYYSAFPTCVV